MKQEIIRKSLILLGSSTNGLQGDAKTSKAASLCEEFASGAIEDIFIAVKWPFALKRISNIEGATDNFKKIEGVEDCIKLAVIAPSNLEWYIEAGQIFFKGKKLDSLFYYSGSTLQRLLNNDNLIVRQVPESFKTLASLSLVSHISFAMYSDSLFADSLKKQYLIKLEETKRLYMNDYNLVNSGEI